MICYQHIIILYAIELGAEIGRNVVVNLTNITKVGNRQIAREIKQINAEQEFAFNS